MKEMFFYVCEHGHKVTAPWPLEACPSFFRGAECPGVLHAADSAFRKRKPNALDQCTPTTSCALTQRLCARRFRSEWR